MLWLDVIINLTDEGIHRHNIVTLDEFNAGGDTLNYDNWSVQQFDGRQLGVQGWGNNELQWYTNRTSNVYVQNGSLVIQAQRESGSALELLVQECREQCTEECKARTHIPI